MPASASGLHQGHPARSRSRQRKQQRRHRQQAPLLPSGHPRGRACPRIRAACGVPRTGPRTSRITDCAFSMVRRAAQNHKKSKSIKSNQINLIVVEKAGGDNLSLISTQSQQSTHIPEPVFAATSTTFYILLEVTASKKRLKRLFSERVERVVSLTKSGENRMDTKFGILAAPSTRRKQRNGFWIPTFS